eukprot:2855533-Prymnesium_polylepis.1
MNTGLFAWPPPPMPAPMPRDAARCMVVASAECKIRPARRRRIAGCTLCASPRKFQSVRSGLMGT